MRHFAFVLLFVTGCASAPNIDGDSRYPSDYRVGQVYCLKQPVFIHGSLFVVRAGAHGGVPSTIEEYRTGPVSRWPDVTGFCVPPEDHARICASEYWDADTFTEEVFRLEGMDPAEHLTFKRQIRKRFTDVFGTSVDPEGFQRRQQCVQ